MLEPRDLTGECHQLAPQQSDQAAQNAPANETPRNQVHVCRFASVVFHLPPAMIRAFLAPRAQQIPR